MSAETRNLESYRTADEQFVVYEPGSACAFVVSDTTVDTEEMR